MIRHAKLIRLGKPEINYTSLRVGVIAYSADEGQWLWAVSRVMGGEILDIQNRAAGIA